MLLQLLVLTQMTPSMPLAMPSRSFRTHITSCSQVLPDQTMMLNSIGSRLNSRSTLRHPITDIGISFSRTVERDVRPAQWSRPCIILKTLSIIMKVRLPSIRAWQHLEFQFSFLDAGFFVFPDLSVRTEGSYRLKLSLFEVVS